MVTWRTWSMIHDQKLLHFENWWIQPRVSKLAVLHKTKEKRKEETGLSSLLWGRVRNLQHFAPLSSTRRSVGWAVGSSSVHWVHVLVSLSSPFFFLFVFTLASPSSACNSLLFSSYLPPSHFPYYLSSAISKIIICVRTVYL